MYIKLYTYFIMDAGLEHRNKKRDKAKKNKGFPYKRISLRREENFKEKDKNE